MRSYSIVRGLLATGLITGVILSATTAPARAIPDGRRFREFAIPTSGSESQSIAAGPDGNLWFTEIYGNRIGRITTTGTITEFPLPHPESNPAGITSVLRPSGSRFSWVRSGRRGKCAGRPVPAGVPRKGQLPCRG